MLSILVQGVLHADPVMRTSAKGQPYATAQLRAAGEDGATVWCSVIAFNAEAVEALAGLANGDPVAIVGRASVTSYSKRDGDTGVGIRITATRVLSVYEAGKRRGAATQRERSRAAELDA